MLNSVEQPMNLSVQFSCQYSIIGIIFLTIAMTLTMVIVVIGNILVIIAMEMESRLNSIQNWFIASLALADLSLGLIVMPFSLAYEVKTLISN